RRGHRVEADAGGANRNEVVGRALQGLDVQRRVRGPAVGGLHVQPPTVGGDRARGAGRHPTEGHLGGDGVLVAVGGRVPAVVVVTRRRLGARVGGRVARL